MNPKHREELIEILRNAGVKPSLVEETADSAIDIFNRYRRYMSRTKSERREIEKEIRAVKSP